MRFIADLHIHSKYARATSPRLAERKCESGSSDYD